MAGFLAVMSTTRPTIDVTGKVRIEKCDASDSQQIGRMLHQATPDVFLLVGLPDDCEVLISTFRETVPWGYVVALLDDCAAKMAAASQQVDEFWSLADQDELEARLRLLQQLAELNRAWQALPKDVATQAAYSSRLTLLDENRIVTPGRAAHQLMVPWEQAIAASAEAVHPRSCSLATAVPLTIFGVGFPWREVPSSATLQVAEWPGSYRVNLTSRRPGSVQDEQDMYRLLADRISLEYELQVERMRGVTLKYETERLSGQITRHGKLAVAGELAAGIAHEIRNPLAAVRGFIQLLRQRLNQANMGTEIRYADYILDEIDRANQILNGFLAMTKPTHEQKQPVDLTALLTDMVQLVKHQAVLKGVELVVDLNPDLPPVWAKSESLKQVFLNLFSNALQATPEGGSITVTTRLEPGYVQADVRDTGVGIAPDQIQRIFAPFYTTKSGGTGLGLAICREILTDHGGTIAVDSAPGAGSTFCVRLPWTARCA